MFIVSICLKNKNNFLEFYCLFLYFYNKKAMSKEPIKKYKVINIQKVLKKYQNNKQITKTIYPHHNQSLSYKIQRQLKQSIKQKQSVSQFKSQFQPAQKYYGKLPQVFKTIDSDCTKNIQRLSQNFLKRKIMIQKNKNIKLVSPQPSKLNRRKLKEVSESTTDHSLFQQVNSKTLQFNQKKTMNESSQNKSIFNRISQRKIKSGNDFVERPGHQRIKTQKYQQLNLRSLIYDDKQLTMSQKKCLKVFTKLNTQIYANKLKSKQAINKTKQKSQNHNFFRFKIYKQKEREAKIQKQHESTVNLQKQQQKVNEGWIINESNASVF